MLIQNLGNMVRPSLSPTTAYLERVQQLDGPERQARFDLVGTQVFIIILTIRSEPSVHHVDGYNMSSFDGGTIF